jgi:hypothetical protein
MQVSLDSRVFVETLDPESLSHNHFDHLVIALSGKWLSVNSNVTFRLFRLLCHDSLTSDERDWIIVDIADSESILFAIACHGMNLLASHSAHRRS